MNLTEKQSKALQILCGIVSGAAIWFSLWISGRFQENELLKWLFLVVFVVVIFIQRTIEKKIGHQLKLFFKVYLISLIVGLGVFVLDGVVNQRF